MFSKLLSTRPKVYIQGGYGSGIPRKGYVQIYLSLGEWLGFDLSLEEVIEVKLHAYPPIRDGKEEVSLHRKACIRVLSWSRSTGIVLQKCDYNGDLPPILEIGVVHTWREFLGA